MKFVAVLLLLAVASVVPSQVAGLPQLVPVRRDQGSGLAEHLSSVALTSPAEAHGAPLVGQASRMIFVRRGSTAPAGSSQGGGASCSQEMYNILMGPGSAHAQKCEQSEGRPQEVINELMNADLRGATQLAAADLQTCGNISSTCAQEAAPEIIMKARLSGLAVSAKCRKFADANMTTAGQQKSSVCQRMMMKMMTDRLKTKDVNGALLMAQNGLHTCVGLTNPCDFQYGPLFLSQVRQDIERQEMMQTLGRGLATADALQANLARGMQSHQRPRDVSLLRVAERIQIASL